MANPPAVVSSVVLQGSISQTLTLQAQPIAGNLVLNGPNTLPAANQLLSVASISGNTITLGWTAPATASVTLSQLAQSGATTNQIISWNGTNWIPTTAIPGEGTVTSVAGAGIATGTVTTTGSITVLGSGNTTTASTAAANLAAAATGHVLTSDGQGNVQDSGTLLSALAPLSSPAALSLLSVTGTGIINTTSGDIAFTQNGSGHISATVGSNSFTILQNGANLTASGASIVIANTGAITITPANGTVTNLAGVTKLSSALQDGTGVTGTAGQILSSTGGGTPTVLWITNPSPVLSSGAGVAPSAGDNHIASGSGAITAGGTVTLTMTGNAVFSDTSYVVQITRTSAVVGSGQLYVTVISGSQFSVSSSDNSDTTSTFNWTAIGY